jgi:hypothetical protein
MKRKKVIDVYYKKDIIARGEITYDDAFINICTMEDSESRIAVLYLMDMDYGIYIPNDVYIKIKKDLENTSKNNFEGGLLQ